MTNNTMTYGEFVDAMEEVAKINIEAEVHLEEWIDLATPKQWEKYRPLPLARDHVSYFAKDMADYFRRTIQGTCGDTLYRQRVEAGHAFLQAIHKKLLELGLEFDLQEIDVPLTPTDAIIRSGAAKIVPE